MFNHKKIISLIAVLVISVQLLIIPPMDDYNNEFAERENETTVSTLEYGKNLLAIEINSLKFQRSIDLPGCKELKSNLMLISNLENKGHKLYLLCFLEIENNIQVLEHPEHHYNFRSPPSLKLYI